jgi:hypothetical protein
LRHGARRTSSASRVMCSDPKVAAATRACSPQISCVLSSDSGRSCDATSSHAVSGCKARLYERVRAKEASDAGAERKRCV